MASIRIEDVRKSYGPVEVLKGFSLDIRDGEFLVLVQGMGNDLAATGRRQLHHQPLGQQVVDNRFELV